MRHKYNRELIKSLAKGKKEINVTELTNEYCSRMSVEYSETKRKHINNLINRLNIKANVDVKTAKEYHSAKKRKIKKRSKTFIVTWAQAHTPINDIAWEGMKALSEDYGSEIIVIPGTYVNPQSRYSNLDTGWSPELIPYLHAKEDKLHKYLSLISDANVLPTAERPLRGFEGVTGEESSIIGHPRHHLEVVPTLPQSKDKYLVTTGAITVPNYRNARVGKKAKFHHQIGFVVVEIFDKNDFVIRHVSCNKDGTFQDLNRVWDGSKISKTGKWESIVFGDLHIRRHHEGMLKETERLMNKMKPKQAIIHDLSDGESVNPHTQKDFVHQVISAKKGLNLIDKELEEVKHWLEEWKKWNLVIVPANHNDWIDRWVRFQTGRNDTANAITYNNLQSILFEEKAPKGLLAYLVDDWFKGEVKTLHRNDSFKSLGHELNNHGDIGANGSRGSKNIYKKLNIKVVSGHSHTPYTLDGAYGVGISTVKDHVYNLGLSSWIQSHGVINENGKFQHLFYVGGKFTNFL